MEKAMENPYYRIIENAIQELNESKEGDTIGSTPDTVLLGPDSAIDSIDLINLIVAIEEKVNAKYGQPINLVSERAMSSQVTPFGSVSSLAAYLEELISENESG